MAGTLCKLPWAEELDRCIQAWPAMALANVVARVPPKSPEPDSEATMPEPSGCFCLEVDGVETWLIPFGAVPGCTLVVLLAKGANHIFALLCRLFALE